MKTFKADIQNSILKMSPLVIPAGGFILIATRKKYIFLEAVTTKGKFCSLKIPIWIIEAIEYAFVANFSTIVCRSLKQISSKNL